MAWHLWNDRYKIRGPRGVVGMHRVQGEEKPLRGLFFRGHPGTTWHGVIDEEGVFVPWATFSTPYSTVQELSDRGFFLGIDHPPLVEAEAEWTLAE